MSRLIDAEELVKLLKANTMSNGTLINTNTMIAVVEKMPTAYDAEAVIDELEYLRAEHEGDMHYWAEHDWKDNGSYSECHLSDRQEVCFEQAIEIVKKGGV